MIKLNIQLFGGSASSASVEDVQNYTQGKISGGSHYVGKVNAGTKAGKLYSNKVWDLAASGRSNKEVRADIQKYFGAQGVTDVKKNLDEKYHNTLHVIESKDDDGGKMMYVVHVGPDGSMRVSEPKESQRVLNHLEAMYASGELSDTANGYFKGANKVNGTVEWEELPPPEGQDASGKAVFVNDKGNIVDREGNPVDQYTDTDGKVIKKDDEGIFKDETGAVVTLTPPIRDNSNALENAYNQYYNDIMAYDQEGTFGNAILNNQVNLKTKEADNAAMLAEANLQSQALGQAQSVRDVVNSLKSERMSQLRAGMNQAQLADRELQMLVGSAGQLAQQNQMARQDAVAADLGQNTAYEMAFNDYITQAQALGQNATANYAALVGDSVTQAKLLEEAKKKNPGFINSFNQATGNTGS